MGLFTLIAADELTDQLGELSDEAKREGSDPLDLDDDPLDL